MEQCEVHGPASQARSNKIDLQLEQDSKRYKKECKILLLGSGESGKSTIVKQMKIIHQQGFSTNELLAFRPIIHKNAVDSAQAVVLACNRMHESLVLFQSVINSRWFLRTSIILFLNKIDLFRGKLGKVPLERYFPEYTGGPNINKATKYVLWRFMQENRAQLSVFPHITQATDTKNIRLVFAAVKETILQNALKDSGIL
ncbi:guanine nucleotide-binding protein alpha-3 subunit [Mycena leptocephala]|nr:guanine nucleotide-binding protein alpha-3 subunit [Mycena leptocephala]